MCPQASAVFPMLPHCRHAPGVFIPIQSLCSSAQKDLAGSSTLHSAAASWSFPRLFSVPARNAAVVVVTGGEGMQEVPIATASDSLSASAPLQSPKGQEDKCGLGVTFAGNLLWEITVCLHLGTTSEALVQE